MWTLRVLINTFFLLIFHDIFVSILVIRFLARVTRAGRRSWGTIVLSRDRTERSRTIPSFRKKNERIEGVLKNIGTICNRTEGKGTETA